MDKTFKEYTDINNAVPPPEVLAESNTVKAMLHNYEHFADADGATFNLIAMCTPYLINIKERLGKDNAWYLRLSTAVVENVLRRIVDDVNLAQNVGSTDKENDVRNLVKVLSGAWRITLLLDKMDMNIGYKNLRYAKCRNSLYFIIDQLDGFSTTSTKAKGIYSRFKGFAISPQNIGADI